MGKTSDLGIVLFFLNLGVAVMNVFTKHYYLLPINFIAMGFALGIKK